MTAAPWSTDRPLGPELAARLIEAQCPELGPVTAESMAEGWDFEAFTVNREWIFRFPKRAGVAPFLESEMRLLEALPELPLQVPRYRWRGRPTEEFPYPFAGYRRIEGTDALYMDARELGEQDVRNLGAFLTALHAFPVERAVELGLPGDVRPTCTMSGMFQRAKDRLLSVVGAAPRELADRCAAFVHDEAGVPGERREPPVPVHNDIWEEHIIVSAEAPHGIVGVIESTDWWAGRRFFRFHYSRPHCRCDGSDPGFFYRNSPIWGSSLHFGGGAQGGGNPRVVQPSHRGGWRNQ